MNTVFGNKLTLKTFDYLKVNKSEIKLPDVFKQDFSLESDTRLNINEFDGVEYGTSADAILINKEFGNVYKAFVCEENTTEDFGVLSLSTDDNHTEIFDTVDILAKNNSNLKLVIDYTSKGRLDKFRNSIIRILANKNSKVELFIIASDDNKTITSESVLAYVKEDATVDIYQYELGSKNLYTNLKGELVGDNGKLNVNSIYFGYDDHTLDLLYNIYHRGKATNANILVNGALKDKAFKVFKSNLDFKEGSSESVGDEQEFAILLSDNVTNISVPVLLCHEDDVVGNHAASAGKIDANILFYLMTRGISEKDAISLIIQSKFSSAIDSLDNEKLKAEVWEKVYKVIN